jgi:transcriptional accessory protein Tex/SPT6
VKVRVIEVDLKRQRIGLTMKLGEPPAAERGERGPKRPAQGGPKRPAQAAGPVEPPKSLEEQLKALQSKFKRL